MAIALQWEEKKVMEDLEKNPPKKNPARRKIPYGLYEEMYNQVALHNKSCREVAEWLKEERGCTVAISTVGKIVEKVRKERESATKSAYAKAANITANEDINRIGAMIEKLHNVFEERLAAGEFNLARLYADTLLKYINQRIQFLGISSKSDMKVENVRDQLIKFLENVEQ